MGASDGGGLDRQRGKYVSKCVARLEASGSSHASCVWSGRMRAAHERLRDPEDKGLSRCDRSHITRMTAQSCGERLRRLPQHYVSRCSIPCFETLPFVTGPSIHSGLSSGSWSTQAHAW